MKGSKRKKRIKLANKYVVVVGAGGGRGGQSGGTTKEICCLGVVKVDFK